MSLKLEFNNGYTAKKENDFVLSVSYNVGSYRHIMAYDFQARVMVMRTDSHGDGGAVLTPFSQLDREVLAEMRDKLIALKGNPPELPAESPINPGVQRRLNP